ncbi:putative microtubule motor [Naematelia encephala]|uniref:Putative microtubule motor n=1 Tax=Naematelia encephala TaxID=71784 RepID=A0A1Y2AGR5_9TREE|nr:putative microtubule motor [Naematelia encephala]
MSRRPTNTKLPTMSRAASSASIAMPPPSRVPSARPPSVMSTTSAAQGRSDETESRSGSPKKAGRKTVVGKGKEKEAEGGEINIQVVVRVRGRSQQELASASPIITTTSGALGKQITIETTPVASSTLAAFTTASSYGAGGPTTKTYPFDKVFGPEADQTTVFTEVAEGMLDEVLAGYNCTIFAYGQTGTGKTFTMQGDLALSPLSAPKDEAGIVPRVLNRLFKLLEAGSYSEYLVKCSYVELYNEELRDLLSTDYDPTTASQRQPMSMNGQAPGGLKLYEDGKKGVLIQGLEEAGVRNLKEALAVLNKGCQRRQVAETKMNTESSRSHTIFSVTVHVKEEGMNGGEEVLRVGKFNLVDLAGSEAIGRSGATDKRAREAGMINQSLLTLGRVISALVEKGSHIPYRESKLTRLLQDSLGGRTKTCIVATVSPTRSNMEETLSTLDYAIRAKSIRNRPEINAHLTKTGLLKEYIGDIERLKNELLAAREKNGIYIPEEQWREMHETQSKQKSDYEEAKLRASACTVELATKKKEFDELSVKILATEAELEQVREAERQLIEMLEQTKVDLERKRVALEEEMAVSEAYIRGEERLDQVATGLKGVAEETVSDVGGLFDKLARKAKVLGTNTDTATRFGSDLQNLSKDLRHGLHKLHKVQDSFGRQVQTELQTLAKSTSETSHLEISSLEESFTSFDRLAQHLSNSIEQGSLDAASASSALVSVKDAIQVSVSEWAQGVSQKSTRMVDELLEHQSEHLSMVTAVLDSTADLVDAVISTARDHLAAETQASLQAKSLAQQASESEISRLRSQNLLLANLLAEEKAKTARLRTDLIGNLTNLIVDFTDTQDKSWSGVVARVQEENEHGIGAMEHYQGEVDAIHAQTASRAEDYQGELNVGTETCAKQRQAGQGALGHVRDGMRTRLEQYARETTGGAETCGRMVEGYCEQIAGQATDISAQGSSRATDQTGALSALSQGMSTMHDASVSRAQARIQDTTTMAQSLLSSNASSASTFNSTYKAAASAVSNMTDATARFLAEGIAEDVPTGITPRKRTYNVQTSWDRTEPRDAIIAKLRATTQVALETTPIPTVPSSTSIASDGSHESTASTNVAPPVSLSTSQMRAPSRSKLGKMGEKELPGDKIVLPPLGESGINLPRRVRK